MLAALRFKDDRGDFYEHFFKTSGWHAYMRQASSTGARHDRMAIASDDFMAMPLPVPSLPEQQKIAKILSTWDQAISTTEQLLANSQQQKKALMQQLLTGKKRLLDKNGVRFSDEWCKRNRSPDPA